MALQTSTRRRSSTSSYRSTAQYSSSFRTEDSADSLDPVLEPYINSGNHSSLFQDEGPGGPKCSSPYSWHDRSSFGNSVSLGSPVMGRPSSTGGGGVRCLGDMYYVSADVSQFEPQDVVVMAYHHHIVIHAAKVGLCPCGSCSENQPYVLDDGRVGDTFTHKSLLPEDMDPLSVSGTFSSDGALVVSVRRNGSLQMEPPGPCLPQ